MVNLVLLRGRSTAWWCYDNSCPRIRSEKETLVVPISILLRSGDLQWDTVGKCGEARMARRNWFCGERDGSGDGGDGANLWEEAREDGVVCCYVL